MRRINVAMLAEGIAFAMLGAILLVLSVTGTYMYYVTPRTLPYLYFASAMLLALGVFALLRMFEQAHIKTYSHMMVLLVPIILLGWSAVDTGILDRLLTPPSITSDSEDLTVAGGGAYTMKAVLYQDTQIHGYDPVHRRIVIPEEETYLWLVEIYENPETFLGFTITTMGQVMKDEAYFTEGTFSPVRQLMTCCTADLYPIGFKCEYGDVDSLQADQWVRVTGTLTIKTLSQTSELRILADTVEEVSPAREPYVYAY